MFVGEARWRDLQIEFLTLYGGEMIWDMTSPNRHCQRSDIEHVRKFVAYAKGFVNATRYYPPLGGYRYMVALALYSKCLTVAEATMLLVNAGFGDEAFGMTRTLVDIFITLRYIANKDIEQRARLYYEFFTKDTEIWGDVIKHFWPLQAQQLDTRTLKLAAAYPNPHRWSGKTVWQMATEPDTVEVDPVTGKPAVHDFAYRVVYRWTSHYVHPTIVALENHVVQAGRDNFVVRSGRDKDKRCMAVFNIGCYVASTMVSFYRCMGDPQPSRMGTWSGALIKHLARRHA